jgi:hypothetical protein
MVPDGRIVLLDLNFTLVANSREFPHLIDREKYRGDLVDFIRDSYVILITVRRASLREATIERIASSLNWQPQEAWFNEGRLKAPECKRRVMVEHVMPKHGADPSGYVAIESNKDTRAMYAGLGIEAMPWQKFGSGHGS